MKTKENVTASSIKRMKYTDLQKLCSKQGIEFKGENREKLVSLLLSKLSSLEGEIPEAEKVGKQEKKDAKATQATSSVLRISSGAVVLIGEISSFIH